MENGKQNRGLRLENGKFAKGSNGGHHGVKGRSGRKADPFIAECNRLIDDQVLPKMRTYLASASPEDVGFRWAADRLLEYGKGKPIQPVVQVDPEEAIPFTLKLMTAQE